MSSITKDNLFKTLRFNKINNVFLSLINGDICVNKMLITNISNPNWLAHLEIEIGKLNHLPEFSFKGYLINQGVSCQLDQQNCQRFEIVSKFARLNTQCLKTERNAKIVIQIFKLMEKLD